MNRRTAIRNVILVSAGTAFLASCQDKATTVLKHIPLTGSDEKLLSALTDAILPKTDFPGAADLKTADFVFMMADDCLAPDDQAKFSKGLKAFDDVCKAKLGDRFADLDATGRSKYLTMIEADKEGKEVGEDARWFYQSVKRGTIHNFTTSEQFLTQVKNFSLIPPKFQACVDVANA